MITPEAAQEVFGESLGLAEAYAQRLGTAGIERGLIGPREVPRLWDRHLLNCALVTDLVAEGAEGAEGAEVVDVGSGAGLPGLAMAIRRPDLRVTLVEPLLRRATFLTETIEELGLTNVEVLRERAENLHGSLLADVVTARAVAPMERLAGWCLPLVRPEGEMLAMKGSSAEEEVEAAVKTLTRLGAQGYRIVEVGTGLVDPPTRVVAIEAGHRPVARPKPSTSSASARAKRRKK